MAIENTAESRTPKWLLPVVLGVALLAVAAAAVVVCLRSRGGAEPEKPLGEAQAALEQAKEKGEDSEEFKAAQAKMAAAKEAFQKNRIKAQTLVRDRIMQENDAIKAKQEASKEKGE